MQTLSGTVLNGVVVLDNGSALPEGTKVRVVMDTAPVKSEESTDKPFAFLREFAGKAGGLPADFAEQHDHYIHGTPKR